MKHSAQDFRGWFNSHILTTMFLSFSFLQHIEYKEINVEKEKKLEEKR